MTRVLVTGAAGFLASHLCDRLLAEGHEVVGVDDLSGGSRTNVIYGTKFWELDCCDFGMMNELFAATKPEVVFHAAASPHEGLSIFSPVHVTKNTYLSTVSVAAAACEHGVRRFVFTSSMARYGYGKSQESAFTMFAPFDETMHPCPVDPYGIAKHAAENTLRTLGRQHGMETVVAVPHSIYGTRQRHYDPYRNVIAIMVNRMLSEKQPIIYGDGCQVRCFTHVADAVDPLYRCGFQPGLDGETINIGPDEDFITINELAERLAAIIGFHLRPIYLPDRPCEVKVAYCSSDKARRLLGYRTTVTLDQGLREMVDWVEKVGTRPFEYHIGLEIPSGKNLPRTWAERSM